MKIIGDIIQFVLDSVGQKADSEEKTEGLILTQIIVLFIFAMCGLLWLFYRFM
jgi:hypothetical protein